MFTRSHFTIERIEHRSSTNIENVDLVNSLFVTVFVIIFVHFVEI